MTQGNIHLALSICTPLVISAYKGNVTWLINPSKLMDLEIVRDEMDLSIEALATVALNV